jgi:hypothetical protein
MVSRRAKGIAMRYRYRTPVLIGEWRSTAAAACKDAVRARQADFGEDSAIQWRVKGRLELGESLRLPKTRMA